MDSWAETPTSQRDSPWPIYGRAGDLAVIDDLLTGARSGRSAALVVRGQAGIGKSTLLDYAADAAQEMRVLRSVGIESEAELPFAGLHMVLRPLP